jgi:hypothetical protein
MWVAQFSINLIKALEQHNQVHCELQIEFKLGGVDYFKLCYGNPYVWICWTNNCFKTHVMLFIFHSFTSKSLCLKYFDEAQQYIDMHGKPSCSCYVYLRTKSCVVAYDTLHRYMIHNPQILGRQELLQNESLKYCVQVLAS